MEKGSFFREHFNIKNLLVLSALILFIYIIRPVLSYLVISGILAYIFNPVLAQFEKRKISRPYALVIMYLLVLLAVIVIFVFAVPPIIKEVKAMQDFLPLIKAKTLHVQELLVTTFPNVKWSEFNYKVSEKLLNSTNRLFEITQNILGNIFFIFSMVALVPFITFFIVKDGRQFKKTLINYIPNRYLELFMYLLAEIDIAMGKYLRGVIAECIIVGVLAVTGLLLIGVDYAFVIGSIAGLANAIPYLGPAAGALPALFVVAVKDFSWTNILSVAAVFASVQFLDNNIIYPNVVGKSVKLHPLVVILALIVGESLGGFIGMFLAIPVVTVLKVVFDVIIDTFFRYKRASL